MKDYQGRNEYFRKYRQTDKWKKYALKYKRLWRFKKGTAKDTLRKKLWYAIKVGKIIKGPCKECGEIQVEAHHIDYRSPMRVEWYCIKHHRLADVRDGKRKS